MNRLYAGLYVKLKFYSKSEGELTDELAKFVCNNNLSDIALYFSIHK